jgi:hypothetical protein
VTSIDRVADETAATIEGTVRAAGELLTAPLSGTACVCFTVRRGVLEQAALEQGGSDFWLEDGSGRALVVMDRFEAVLPARQLDTAVKALDADVVEVGDRLRELKHQLKRASPAEQPEISRRILHFRGLATLLCSVRAHARGRLHSAKSLAMQAELIERESARYREVVQSPRLRELMVARHESLLREGDRARVSGWCRWEADAGAAGGYRSAGRRLRVSAAEHLMLEVSSAAGRKQRVRAVAKRTREDARRTGVHQGEAPASSFWLFAALAFVAGLAAYWLL